MLKRLGEATGVFRGWVLLIWSLFWGGDGPDDIHIIWRFLFKRLQEQVWMRKMFCQSEALLGWSREDFRKGVKFVIVVHNLNTVDGKKVDHYYCPCHTHCYHRHHHHHHHHHHSFAILGSSSLNWCDSISKWCSGGKPCSAFCKAICHSKIIIHLSSYRHTVSPLPRRFL